MADPQEGPLLAAVTNIEAAEGTAIANIEDIENDDWNFILGVNLNGVLNCRRAEIKPMKENGSIVNASSIAGIIGMEKNGAYIVSKHAVVGLTTASAKELGTKGLRVNAITP